MSVPSQDNLNNGDSLLTALVSGFFASAVSATFTYPLDSMKTQQQLTNNALLKKHNLEVAYSKTIGQFFKGGSALVIGSLFKNSARIISYNWSSKFMSIDTHDANGEHRQKTSAPRMVIAGAMSGFIETLWIIPFENIKITMVQNMLLHNEIIKYSDRFDVTGHYVSNKHHKPIQNIFSKQYVSPHAYLTSELYAQLKGARPTSKFNQGSNKIHPNYHNTTKLDSLKMKYNKSPSSTFLHTIKEMYQLKGMSAFTSGTCITFIRQIALSGVWLSTYNATRQLIDPHNTSNEQSWFGHKHTAIQSVGLHVLSSTAVVLATQPLDVIKTHLQSKNGKLVYRDSLSTAFKLFLSQGPTAMFKGAIPRGLKILINGGLTAAVYGKVEDLVNVASDQQVFGE